MKYYCSECGLAVIVLLDQEPIKACKCNAPIYANAESRLNGTGGLKV